MKHRRKHKTAQKKSSRKKAFWLLIILGVAVMGVYMLSFQEAHDDEFLEETNPAINQSETE